MAKRSSLASDGSEDEVPLVTDGWRGVGDCPLFRDTTTAYLSRSKAGEWDSWSGVATMTIPNKFLL